MDVVLTRPAQPLWHNTHGQVGNLRDSSTVQDIDVAIKRHGAIERKQQLHEKIIYIPYPVNMEGRGNPGRMAYKYHQLNPKADMLQLPTLHLITLFGLSRGKCHH